MSITIKDNTVTIPRTLHDQTLPWSYNMRKHAGKAERKDSLSGSRYTFGTKKEADVFYLDLITKPPQRNIRFNNEWMRLEQKIGQMFIHSDGFRFAVTLVTDSDDLANEHCLKHDDRGVIATDQYGNHYVAMCEAS